MANASFRLLLGIGVSLVSFAAVGATVEGCAFPEVTFASADDGGAGDPVTASSTGAADTNPTTPAARGADDTDFEEKLIDASIGRGSPPPQATADAATAPSAPSAPSAPAAGPGATPGGASGVPACRSACDCDDDQAPSGGPGCAPRAGDRPD